MDKLDKTLKLKSRSSVSPLVAEAPGTRAFLAKHSAPNSLSLEPEPC